MRLDQPAARSKVLYRGGNVFCIHDAAPDVAQAFTRGWRPHLVFVDYRGFGPSTGRPTLEKLQADARLVLSNKKSFFDLIIDP